MQIISTAFALLAGAALVNAHGHMGTPVGLQGAKDIRIPAQGCGTGVTVGGKASQTFKAGSTATVMWVVVNGDGGGPMAVKFDTTGKGTQFSTTANVTENIGGVNGAVPAAFPKGPHPLSFVVPNTKCTNCVMQVRQNLSGGGTGFGSCVMVNIA